MKWSGRNTSRRRCKTPSRANGWPTHERLAELEMPDVYDPMIEGAEKAFLRGKRTHHEDLESAVTIFLELLRGFESFDFEGPCVTVFGSARFTEGHRYYELARRLGHRLAEEGYTVLTGGGYIRYRPKDGDELFGSSSMETEMLLKALDDYQYEELDAAMAYKPDGQLTMQLQMKGRSPGLHATRPLHLNLNLDQNILSLVQSLRAVNGLNDRIDSAVKKHFKARNR